MNRGMSPQTCRDARTSTKRAHLKLAILNDSELVLKMFCAWFQNHGHHCITAPVADMPNAHEDIAGPNLPDGGDSLSQCASSAEQPNEEQHDRDDQ